MSYQAPEAFSNVSVSCKANIYFDGKVVSHAVTFADGSRKTLGVVFPGSFLFETLAPERMEIIAGECRVKVAGRQEWQTFAAGSYFDVPGESAFEIVVEKETAEYVCSYG